MTVPNPSKRYVSAVTKDKETRGYATFGGLGDRQVGTIIGVKLGDANADSYKYEPRAALLA